MILIFFHLNKFCLILIQQQNINFIIFNFEHFQPKVLIYRQTNYRQNQSNARIIDSQNYTILKASETISPDNRKAHRLCELLYLLYACSFSYIGFCLNIGVTAITSSQLMFSSLQFQKGNDPFLLPIKTNFRKISDFQVWLCFDCLDKSGRNVPIISQE